MSNFFFAWSCSCACSILIHSEKPIQQPLWKDLIYNEASHEKYLAIFLDQNKGLTADCKQPLDMLSIWQNHNPEAWICALPPSYSNTRSNDSMLWTSSCPSYKQNQTAKAVSLDALHSYEAQTNWCLHQHQCCSSCEMALSFSAAKIGAAIKFCAYALAVVS